jgi:hypothetical protein
MTNPDSAIIRTSKTRDGITVFLHEDGTVSDRLATCGFTVLTSESMHKFFDRVDAVLHADVPRAIKRANKNHMPSKLDEDILVGESRARVDRIRLVLEHDRRVNPEY